MLKIKIKKVHQDAIIPNYAHDGDAGMDLYSIEDKILNPGQVLNIKTGIKIEMEKGYEMQIRPKSGIALKNNVTLPNTPGTVDSGYRGEIVVIMVNNGKKIYEIKKGQKIAQAVFNKIEEVKFVEVDELSETSRGEGGFGSTGLGKIGYSK